VTYRDRDPNLFEQPTVICYCVPQGPSQCAACRQRTEDAEDMATLNAAFGVTVPPPAPAPQSPPPATRNTGHAAGDPCPQCIFGYLLGHPVSGRLMCVTCGWGVGDVIKGATP
jgi:hypothetical protein